MDKKPILTLEQIREITKTYPTPFHVYDEKAIKANARALYDAFSWNKGYREFFAVKANPNPFILQILKDCGCGSDCSSMAELVLSKAVGNTGHMIMFSSNDTPLEEFTYCNELGGIINLDDVTDDDKAFLREVIAPMFDMSVNNLTEEIIESISLAAARSTPFTKPFRL